VIFRCGTGYAALHPCVAGDGVTDIFDAQVRFTMGEANGGHSVPFDLGFPGLRLKTDEGIQTNVGWHLNVGFGLSKTHGFYVLTDVDNGSDPWHNAPELAANVTVDAPSSMQGDIAFLRVDITDNDQAQHDVSLDTGLDIIGGTHDADGQTKLGLDALAATDPATSPNVELTLGGAVHVDLHLVTTIDLPGTAEDDMPGGGDPSNGAMPKLLADFHLDWDFGANASLQGAGLDIGDLEIGFQNVQLDVGQFFEQFLGPIAREVKRYTQPLQPVIDTVEAPIPGISDLSVLAGQGEVTFLDYFENASGADLTMIRRLITLIDMINKLPESGSTLTIGDGKFDLDTDALDSQAPSPDQADRLIDSSTVEDVESIFSDPSVITNPEGRAAFEAATEASAGHEGGGVSFPAFEHPEQLFQMIVGKDVRLVRVDLGTLRASMAFDVTIGPFPAGPIPVSIVIGGSAGVEGRFAVVYTTRGIRSVVQKLTDDDPDNDNAALVADLIFQGVGLDDFDAAGQDVPEIRLWAEVHAGASVDVKIISVGIVVGLQATVDLNLHDGGRLAPDGHPDPALVDGVLYIDEIVKSMSNPLCLFDVDGALDAFVKFFVTIGIDPFSVDFDITLVQVRLLDMRGLEKELCDPKPPHLAEQSATTLVLKVGPNTPGRNVDEDKPAEKIVVRQLPPKDGDPTGPGHRFSVTGFGITQEYPEAGQPLIEKIFADGGSDNDQILMQTGVEASKGAEPNPAESKPGQVDTEFLPVDVPVELCGGGGDDKLVGGTKADHLVGDGAQAAGFTCATGENPGAPPETHDGNDELDGQGGGDTLDGGGGGDIVLGGDGADTINAGSGSDQARGGQGEDHVNGQDGDDAMLEGGPEANVAAEVNDVIEGGNGVDILQGDEGDDTMLGGNQDDTMAGGPGSDTMQGQADNDTLVGNAGDDWTFGGTGHDRVFGQEGADHMFGDLGNSTVDGGNDDLVGDVGADEIHGGGGRDYILGDRGGIERNPGDTNAKVTPDQTLGDADTIDGDGGDDVIHGQPGIDTVHGGLDNDELHGDAGTDKLFGDENDDTMFGGIDADEMSGGSNEDVMRGDDGNDTMHGDGEHDVMFGDAGTDTMFGDGGPDRMRGGTEADVVHGNDGEDVMNGDAGTDSMYGDADHDVMSGDADDDYMEGNSAADTMSGGPGQDDILGGTGSAGQPDAGDTICGYDCATPLLPGSPSDADVIVGDNGQITRPGGVRVDGAFVRAVTVHDLDAAPGVYGDDTVSGDYDADRVFGGRGNDTLHGNAADDAIEGNGDNDSIFGDEGQDDLIGGTAQDGGGHTDGDDCIQGDARANDCKGDGSGGGSAAGGTAGGAGNADVIIGDNGSIARTTGATDWARDTFGAGYESVVRRTKTLFDVATVTTPAPANTSGGDTIYGDVAYDLIWGQGGDDEIHGGDADDYAEGNAGTDTMFGENGSDDLLGGSADATWADANDVISGGAGFDVAAGDNAGIARPRNGATGPWFLDTFRAGDVQNVVRRNVTLLNVDVSGSPAPSAVVYGGDTINGDDAYDVLFGQSGVDTIHGDAGDDYVEGNAGGDTLTGDAGDDDVTGGGSANDGVIDADRVGEDLRDGADTVNGDSGDASTGAGDAIAADNARILRPLGGGLWRTDAQRGAVLRDVQLFDLQKVNGAGGATAPADVSDGDTVHGDGGPDVVFGQGNGPNADAYGTESGAAGNADCFDRVANGDTDALGQLVDLSDPECRAAVPNGDKLYGDGGVDYLEGNQGSDLVAGGADEDDVVGGSSSNTGRIDVLRVPAERSGAPITPDNLLDGNDVVQGSEEDDTVVGDNAFVDRYVGAGGVWQHITSTLSGPVTSVDGGQYGPYDLVRRNVTMKQTPESAGAFGSDLVLGNDGVDDLYGQLGHDWLEGGAGDDGIVADLGRIDDNLLGTAADGLTDPVLNQQIAPQQPFIKDTINVSGVLKRQVQLFAFTGAAAGKGDDTAQGGSDNDWIHMGPGEDLANGNAGEDRIYGGDNADATPLANNQAKVDALWGGEGHDHLWGGYGADFLDVRPRGVGTGLAQADPPTWFQLAGAGIADFEGVDYIYGGFDQDAMQANVGDNGPAIGDRLLDWSGAYNVYYVCPGTYGDFISTRLLAPGMIDFLQTLSQGDGADNVKTSSSSGFRETGLVFSADIKSNTNPVHPDTPGHFTCGDV
jgi:Ca2+-binding RTX toxin-like protein